MRKILFGLCLASLGIGSRAWAKDVVASSSRQQPVAISASARRPAVPAPAPAPSAVQLGRPRVTRAASPDLSPIIPVAFIEPASTAPGTNGGSGNPALLPETVVQPTSFAIERTALFLPEPNAVPVGETGETLKIVPNKIGADAPAEKSELFDFTGQPSAPANRIYGSAEYLLWWTKDANVPPLVTTSDAADLGFIGQPSTRVLFGGDTLDQDPQHGGRFRLGYWFDTCDRRLAVEGSFFFLAQNSADFSADSGQFPNLFRPFFSLNRNREFSQFVAFENEQIGRIDINSPTDLFGADLNVRCPIWCNDSCMGSIKVDLLGGFRYVHLHDQLSITEQGVSLPTATLVPPNQAFIFNDTFETWNNFYGGQVGVVAGWEKGSWSVDVRGTIAAGVTHQTVEVSGQAVLTNPDGTVSVAPGALLSGPTNIGRQSRNRFSIVPEAQVSVGYKLTDWCKATLGYNFLYWTNVLRAGDQVDRGLDERGIPFFLRPGEVVDDPLRPGPVVPFKDTSFWAQGLTVGLEFKY